MILCWRCCHRARYYDGRHYDNWTPSNSSRYSKTHPSSKTSKSPNVDLSKVDDDALLIGAAAVAVASAGMIVGVVKNWNVADDRFPYVSVSPQVQMFTQTGVIRDVLEFKCRMGNRGGISLMGDLGFATGSLFEKDMYKPGFTWSMGAGLDIGAFSMSFRVKPAILENHENFISCQLGYDIFLTKNFGLDLRAGASITDYQGDLYWDVPTSVGIFWKF